MRSVFFPFPAGKPAVETPRRSWSSSAAGAARAGLGQEEEDAEEEDIVDLI